MASWIIRIRSGQVRRGGGLSAYWPATEGKGHHRKRYPSRLDLNDTWARAAKELGVKMSFSSDAHEPEQLKVMKYGVKVARRGWLEKKDLLNTLSLAEREKHLKR